MIYMDHAATTPVKPAVLQAMLPYFTEEFANASGSYAAARQARAAIERAREQVANLIGADAQEIYFTSGGSEADNWALTGVLRAAASKNHIITSSVEHHAVLATCQDLIAQGKRVDFVPVDENGLVQLDAIDRAISPDTALISVMTANNEVGTIQPLQAVVEMARQHGIPVHTDAVQAAGHIPIDVHAWDVDFLSLSAHKFYGPKGIGALYVKKGARIERLIRGGAQERGMRAGTENTAAIVGMGKAAELAAGSLSENMRKITELRDVLIRKLQERIPGISIHALHAPRLPGHVHLSLERYDTALLLMQLDMHGVAASAGSACASGSITRSHVLTAMGVAGDGQADLRLTLGEDNTSEEIDKVVEILANIYKK